MVVRVRVYEWGSLTPPRPLLESVRALQCPCYSSQTVEAATVLAADWILSNLVVDAVGHCHVRPAEEKPLVSHSNSTSQNSRTCSLTRSISSCSSSLLSSSLPSLPSSPSAPFAFAPLFFFLRLSYPATGRLVNGPPCPPDLLPFLLRARLPPSEISSSVASRSEAVGRYALLSVDMRLRLCRVDAFCPTVAWYSRSSAEYS